MINTLIDSQMWDAINALFGKQAVFEARKTAADIKGRNVLKLEAFAPNASIVVRLEFNFNSPYPRPEPEKSA